MRAILLDGHLYATAELAEKLAPWPVVVCDEWEIEQLQGEGYAGMCLRHPSPKVRQAGQAFMALPAAERLARIRTAAKRVLAEQAEQADSELSLRSRTSRDFCVAC